MNPCSCIILLRWLLIDAGISLSAYPRGLRKFWQSVGRAEGEGVPRSGVSGTFGGAEQAIDWSLTTVRGLRCVPYPVRLMDNTVSFLQNKCRLPMRYNFGLNGAMDEHELLVDSSFRTGWSDSQASQSRLNMDVTHDMSILIMTLKKEFVTGKT